MGKNHIVLFVFASLFLSCHSSKPRADIAIETPEGEIGIRLYDETPLHKRQILADIDSGLYKNASVFRIVEDFVIQIGVPNKLLDSTRHYPALNPEIKPNLHHFRGAVAIPRLSDERNPYRYSAPLQFYIVIGRTYTDVELDDLEILINQIEQKNEALRLSLEPGYDWLRKINTDSLTQFNPDSLAQLNKWISQQVNQRLKPFSFSDSARQIYRQKGGAPMLDNQYTIVGEVVSGMHYVEKISKALINPQTEQPLKSIPIKIKHIVR